MESFLQDLVKESDEQNRDVWSDDAIESWYIDNDNRNGELYLGDE